MNGGTPVLGEVLHADAQQADGETIVALVGEFDMSGTAKFWVCTSEALGARPPAMAVDA